MTMNETEGRAALVAEAGSWMGTPYHNCARIKGIGVDCLQILAGVYANVGLIEPPPLEHYAPDWHMHRSEERYLLGIAGYLTRTETPKPGDVALFKFGRCVSHAAIVIEWPRVIHSFYGLGVVEADANDAELAGRLHSCWTMWP